jgi:gas vesicle protein
MSDQDARQSDQGSFLTGFCVGVLSGAVGYFLFATDRGEKVRRSFQDEWQSASKQMVSQSGEVAVSSVRSILREVVDHVATKFELQEIAPKATQKKKKESTKTSNKFKGV